MVTQPDADKAHDRTLRLKTAEAAEFLGISVEAVRARIKRGTLDTERDAAGTVYVLLDPALSQPVGDGTANLSAAQGMLISRLEDEVSFLRSELERKDTIILSLTQRIPELEPATEPPDARQTPGEGPDGVGGPAPHAEEAERRQPWWRRVFGA